MWKRWSLGEKKRIFKIAVNWVNPAVRCRTKCFSRPSLTPVTRRPRWWLSKPNISILLLVMKKPILCMNKNWQNRPLVRHRPRRSVTTCKFFQTVVVVDSDSRVKCCTFGIHPFHKDTLPLTVADISKTFLSYQSIRDVIAVVNRQRGINHYIAWATLSCLFWHQPVNLSEFARLTTLTLNHYIPWIWWSDLSGIQSVTHYRRNQSYCVLWKWTPSLPNLLRWP